MIYDTYAEVNDKTLKAVPEFAGMSIDEIRDWVALAALREHARWSADYQSKLEQERKQDKEYLEKGDKNVINHALPVSMERCVLITPDKVDDKGFARVDDLLGGISFTRLSVGDKKIYLPQKVS